MEIGISSACFYPDIVLEDSISIMKSLGFKTGELFINTISECNEDYILKIKEEIIKNKFNIRSVHFFQLCMNLSYLIIIKEEDKML